MARRGPIVALALVVAVLGCGRADDELGDAAPATDVERRLARYATVRLTADLTALDASEKAVLRLMIEAARAIDGAFWLQSYGNRHALLESIDDPATRRLADWNYGPWDRLDDNVPFVRGVGPKPPGAGFYPPDVTREEFEQAVAEDPQAAAALRSPYTVVRRDGRGRLVARPYHEAYADAVEIAAAKLRAAAVLARPPALARYLEARAAALVSSDYRASDEAWLEMRDNVLDVVIGPIETYEDRLLGIKAAFEAFVLIKDRPWSARLARYAELLPELQKALPVPEAYKQEPPGSDADLAAYDVVYYAGDGNAGSKTIAINLPNDEQLQQTRGSRRLQLKNAMRAKFDAILLPLAAELIAEDQRPRVTFDAFFGNTMFHEVAHGLGIRQTTTGRGSVREALRDQFSAVEEGKADVLGLFLVTQLLDRGLLEGPTLEEHYVTMLGGMLRSIRFGAASPHARANLVRFNFLRDRGAVVRDDASGTYRVKIEYMRDAVDALSGELLRLQGDGDREAARAFLERLGRLDDRLAADLRRLDAARIPVDVVFEQGVEVLGL